MMPSRGRWRRFVGSVAVGLVLLWMLYKVASMRRLSGDVSIDTGCASDSTTTVQTAPGTPPIRCEAWDIGTGVTGYSWSAPNQRAVLLLQTGWGDYVQRYVTQGSQLIPHLLARGISVYGFDMWGSGRSPGKRGVTHIGQAGVDHLAARQALRDQQVPVFVLGHSVGGLVTVTSALGDQEGIHGLILLAPAIRWELNPFLKTLARVMGFVAPTLPIPGPGGGTPPTGDPESQRRMQNDTLMFHGALSWSTAGSGVKLSDRNWSRYGELRVPVLVVHGSADQTPGPAASQDFIDVVSSSDKTMHVIAGGAHAILDDSTSTQVLSIILEWIDRRLGPPIAPNSSSGFVPPGGAISSVPAPERIRELRRR
jgi:alpha-beta hydrolase superfamily lysophospholipase